MTPTTNPLKGKHYNRSAGPGNCQNWQSAWKSSEPRGIAPESRLTGSDPPGTKAGFTNRRMGIIGEIRVQPSETLLAKSRWLRTQPVNRVLPLTLTRQSLGDLELQRTSQDQFHRAKKT